jgi:hypothetical protein
MLETIVRKVRQIRLAHCVQPDSHVQVLTLRDAVFKPVVSFASQQQIFIDGTYIRLAQAVFQTKWCVLLVPEISVQKGPFRRKVHKLVLKIAFVNLVKEAITGQQKFCSSP